MQSACLFFLTNIWFTFGLRILGIFPLYAKSHSIMFIEIMKGLAVNGHQVEAYTYYPLNEPIPNYTDNTLFFKGPKVKSDYNRITGQRPFNVPKLVDLVGKSACELMDLEIFQKLFNKTTKFDLVITEVSIKNLEHICTNTQASTQAKSLELDYVVLNLYFLK